MPGPIGLLDLVRRTEKVDVGGGKTIEVGGLTAKSVALLIGRFPPLQKALVGRGLEFAEVATLAPGAVSAIIAAACGMLNNEQAEQNAEDMALEAQVDALNAIGRLTFSNGFGPFVKKLEAILKAVSDETISPLDMKSRKPSPRSEAQPIPKSGI